MDVVLSVDLEGNFTNISSQYQKILGKDQVSSKPVLELFDWS